MPDVTSRGIEPSGLGGSPPMGGREAVSPDAWGNGLARNRKNLERFIQYELDQGLIDRRLEVEELFHEATHTT